LKKGEQAAGNYETGSLQENGQEVRMSASDQYLFADFTCDNYRRLLRLAMAAYPFRGYTDFGRNERFILWRHDIDFSPHAARNLAMIEAEEGAQTTYMLLLHSGFYNLLDHEASECIRDILSAGHSIGLHFDTDYYGIEVEDDLHRHLEREKSILEDVFVAEIHAFSFHNPTPFAMTCRRMQYGGMINTYSEYFQTQVGYCSDSNGHWRFRRLEDVLLAAEDDRLQVLTHPVWWRDNIMSPRERIQGCVTERATKNMAWYDDQLRISERKNID
jgi:hypothetical protein